MKQQNLFQTKNRQHLVCIQWVDQEFEVHKELIRLHAINFNNASHVCLCFNQSCNQSAISKIRGQCCDINGAAAMAEPDLVRQNLPQKKTVYTLHGQALNLACADTIKKHSFIKMLP